MNRHWTKADSWFRRDAGDGVASVTVSRRSASEWCWVMGTPITVLGKAEGFKSAQAAMTDADMHLMATYGAVA